MEQPCCERLLQVIAYRIKYIYESDHWEYASIDITDELDLVGQPMLKENKEAIVRTIDESFDYLKRCITDEIINYIDDDYMF
jgi:hypothetical protein